MRTGFPRTIIKYITGQMTRAFLMTLSIVTVLWVFVFTLQLVRHRIIGPKQLLFVIPLLTVVSLSYTLPIAVLFGVSVAYGRMSTENEIRAMAWNGVHLGWAMLPAAGVALVATALSLYVNTYVAPAALRTRDRVVAVHVIDAVDRNLLHAARSQEPLELDSVRTSVYLKGYDRPTHTMKGVTIIVADDKWHSTRRIDADSARIVDGKVPGALEFRPDADRPESKRQFVTFVFANGYITRFNPESKMALRDRAVIPSVAIDISEDVDRVDFKSLSLGKLAEFARTAHKQSQRNKAGTLVYQRIALGLSPLFFALVAAPMAMVARWKHTLTAFLPSLCMAVVVYYPLVMWAKVQGEAGSLDPLYGMFAGNAVMLVISVVLILVVLRR
ncbi:MAG: LptF/LptG family permease [Planctomycetes bacterium]|nr:LptF/LptG family permease [Planctomycetota bacterium]